MGAKKEQRSETRPHALLLRIKEENRRHKENTSNESEGWRGYVLIGYSGRPKNPVWVYNLPHPDVEIRD